MIRSPDLFASRRARELALLAGGHEVDVLVVGGGVTGAGVALDAASRGLSVALVERGDLASGTSRWSSKLAHGGLRYLAQGDVGVAWESAQERAILVDRTAPHLVRALPMLVALGADLSPAQGRLVATGLRAGDVMRRAAGTSRRRLPRTRRIGAAEAQRWVPGLRLDGLRGGLLSWDGQLEDDARLVVALARTAAAHGAAILPHVRALRLHADGATVLDALDPGARGTRLRARHVVNATGVWAAGLVDGIRLRPSRGSHLLLDAAALGDPAAALNVPVPGTMGRFVFAVPRPDGLVMVGLTDEPLEAGELPDVPEVSPAEEAFLLATLGRALARPVGSADVVGRFAGLRPLLEAGGKQTADVSRRHAVLEDPATRVLTVIGGKLTTYRRMAEDVVDRIAARPFVAAGPCRTHDLPVVGAPGGPSVTLATRARASDGDAADDPGADGDRAQRRESDRRGADGRRAAHGDADHRGATGHDRDHRGADGRRAAHGGADHPGATGHDRDHRGADGRGTVADDHGPRGLPPRLVRRFGGEAAAVAALADERPELLSPVAPGVPVLGVELLWAVSHEGALTAGDVLDGRVRAGLVPAWREAAAAVLGELLPGLPDGPPRRGSTPALGDEAGAA